MSAPKGFRKVTFEVFGQDGVRGTVSCLVCDICQAMILQNVPQDFAAKHKGWHEQMAKTDDDSQ